MWVILTALLFLLRAEHTLHNCLSCTYAGSSKNPLYSFNRRPFSSFRKHIRPRTNLTYSMLFQLVACQRSAIRQKAPCDIQRTEIVVCVEQNSICRNRIIQSRSKNLLHKVLLRLQGFCGGPAAICTIVDVVAAEPQRKHQSCLLHQQVPHHYQHL